MWHSPRESRGLSASENVGPADGGNYGSETLGSTSVNSRNLNIEGHSNKGENKRHICDKCGKSFAYKNGIKDHKCTPGKFLFYLKIGDFLEIL